MIKKDLFKKTGYALITLLTSLTLTACSFQLKPVVSIPDTHTGIEVIVETVDSLTDDSLKDTITVNSAKENLKEDLKSCGYELEKATLVRVVDGDTIVVELNNEDVKVRFIGVNTPESVASKEYLDKTGKENSKEGKLASEFTKDILSDYSEVYLQKDVSETDKYGRLLRYVWLEVPSNCDDIEEIRTKMLNGILLDNGYAEVTIYYPDSKYVNEFEKIADDYYDRENE